MCELNIIKLQLFSELFSADFLFETRFNTLGQIFSTYFEIQILRFFFFSPNSK